MKIEQVITEHKKGVKAVKYAKKPVPLVGPDATKKTAKQKTQPPKTELQKHSKLTAELKEDNHDDEDYYYVVRHQTEQDIELEMPPKMWTGLKPKHATYEEAKDALENLKNKHPREKFTVTRHPRTSYVGGSPTQQFPEGVAEGMDYSKRTKLIRYLAKKLDIEINYLELASDDELIDLYKKSKDGMSESKPKGYDSDGNPQGGGYDEYDNTKSWTVLVNGKAWKTFDDERQAYRAADAIQQKYGKKTRVVSESIEEGKIKINIKHQPETAQEKLYKKHQELRKKSGLPDPSEYKKKAAEKQKEIDDMKEAKQPEATKPRNFVAKNAKTAGAGAHKDAKKAAKEVRGQKHKNKEIAEAEMGKIVDYKPVQTATLNTGPGMTTILDLKKNPTSLTKDPTTGKLKLLGPQAQGTPASTSTQASTIKPGDAVEIGKVTEDILRLAGLK